VIEAQYLFTDVADPGESFYSPWFSKGADNAEFTLDIDQINGVTLAIDVLTKSSETTGDSGSSIGTLGAQSSTGQKKFTGTAANELVRYKFTVTATTEETLGYVLFRMLAPSWYDAVKA
jgi:hypothetical protein